MPPIPDDARRDPLFRRLQALKDLPPAPRTLAALWDVLEQGAGSASALAEVLSRDPALSAKVMRLANSAYYGLPQPVSDVRAACVMLGFDTIRAMAAGVAALDPLTRGVRDAIDLDGFWRHSVGVATAAQALARRAGIAAAGTAFCAGVLHDVGKLVLATLSPSGYRALDPAGRAPDLAAEAAAFGADHTEVGAWFGTRWHFPPEILDAIRTHHRATPDAGLWGVLIRVADGIACRGGCPDPGGDSADGVDAACLARLPLDAAAAASVETDFAAALERVEAFADAARSAP